MANSKGTSTLNNIMSNGKSALLPPRVPHSGTSPLYVDFIPGNSIGSKAVQKPMEGASNNQRTSSETLVMEEQPSWLDDLLDEPETPVRQGGHRRSSSDSFAYIDGGNNYRIDYLGQDEYSSRNKLSMPLWGSQDFEFYKDSRNSSLYSKAIVGRGKNYLWDPSVNTLCHSSGSSSVIDSVSSNITVTSPLEAEVLLPIPVSDLKDPKETSKAAIDRKDGSQPKSGSTENDTKRAKQQFAQRSRVRKLQYIAELERNVQALQAEGSEFSAELEFLNQQNLILNMENKALKQRLESLAQEHLIKRLEHDVLEREIGRLQTVYHQHQQQQSQPSPGHRRSNSKDLECQFTNLSLKQRSSNPGRDPTAGPLRI